MPKWPECNQGHKVTCGITPHRGGVEQDRSRAELVQGNGTAGQKSD